MYARYGLNSSWQMASLDMDYQVQKEIRVLPVLGVPREPLVHKVLKAQQVRLARRALVEQPEPRALRDLGQNY